MPFPYGSSPDIVDSANQMFYHLKHQLKFMKGFMVFQEDNYLSYLGEKKAELKGLEAQLESNKNLGGAKRKSVSLTTAISRTKNEISFLRCDYLDLEQSLFAWMEVYEAEYQWLRWWFEGNQPYKIEIENHDWMNSIQDRMIKRSEDTDSVGTRTSGLVVSNDLSDEENETEFEEDHAQVISPNTRGSTKPDNARLTP